MPPTILGFGGVRSTNDFVVNQRPEDFRQAMMVIEPNGMTTLTALTSLIKSEETTDPKFHWWTKGTPTQRGAILGVFTDIGMGTPYVSGGVAGDTLYLNVAEADANQVRTGHQLLLRDASALDVDVNVKVTDVNKAGASSRLTVKLLEDDDNGAANDLSDADVFIIIGNINEEGAMMPASVTYDPVEYTNLTQIFRTSLNITRTARRTKLRTPNAYKEAKRECLQLHELEMERGVIWGEKSEGVGEDGQPERTTQGIVPFLRENLPANISDYRTAVGYGAGTLWTAATNGGFDWLNDQLEILFRFARGEVFCLCGSEVQLGLMRIAASLGTINLEPKTLAFGIQTRQWVTAFGIVNFVTHPLMTYEATFRNGALFGSAKNVRERLLEPTMFKEDDRTTKGGVSARDGTQEEYLTETGFEWHNHDAWMYLMGFNENRP